jgi:hypothetical protein
MSVAATLRLLAMSCCSFDRSTPVEEVRERGVVMIMKFIRDVGRAITRAFSKTKVRGGSLLRRASRFVVETARRYVVETLTAIIAELAGKAIARGAGVV